MSKESLTLEQVLTMLAQVPPRLTELIAGLKPPQLQTPPGPDEWSANDVLAHLRSCADMWGKCIETMLDEDSPTIRAINPRTWIHQTNYLELKFHPSLRAFTKQRNALLALLEPLSPQDWLRSATITGAGKPLERTVLFYAQWMAEHERPHLKQIEHIVNGLRT